ncbi:hypothetical protein [Paenibacillus faecalis]|uniref:hypothetical protein n=1 Tax=Paenibacillus faecalis TaxID=2079532 RepID=UPI00131A6058|nr:hypothetical protein [Paenibacillus faecalis]
MFGKIERLGFYPLTNCTMGCLGLELDQGLSFLQDDGKVTTNTPNKLASLTWVNDHFIDYYGKKKLDTFTAE